MIVGTIALFMWFFGGGGGADTFRGELLRALELAPTAITETEQLHTVEEVLERAVARIDTFDAELRTLRTEYVTLDQDYNSTPEQIEGALDRIDQAWGDLEKDMIDLRFELREHVNAEQWSVLFPPP